MSDVEENGTGENSGEENAPKTLREQNAKFKADNDALRQQLESLQAQVRSRTIADVLRDKGASPKLAKYVERDIEGDVTEDAVVKWLTDEGDVFGYKPQAQSESEGGEQHGEQDGGEVDEVDENVALQAQRISFASSHAPAMPTGWTPDRIAKASDQQLIDSGWLEPK